VSRPVGTYEETEREDTNQTKFLPFAQVEAGERWQWQKEDDDIGNDVASRVDIPERQVRDAGPREIRIPELFDGRAGEDDDKKLRD